jgi:hypothetical protein
MEDKETVVEEAEVKPSKKDSKESSPFVDSVVEVPPETVVVKRFSFEQWAARRGVPSHNRGGLRAYVNNVSKHRTLEEWDECFRGY